MPSERFQTLQWIIGIGTLTLVLLSSLALGANRPVSWSLLTFAVLALFTVQVLRALLNRLPYQLRRLWLPGTLYLGVLIWAYIQTVPNLFQLWSHPIWELVVADGYISAVPSKGEQGVVRLCLYAMVFIICAWTFTHKSSADWGLRMIALWSTLLAIFGFYSLAVGENLILGDAAADVMQASFINRNSYATYAIFGALANIGVYLGMVDQGSLPGERLRWRNMIESFFGGAWIFAIGALLCMAAVALTASRGGALAGLVGLVVFTLSWVSKGRSEQSDRSTGSGLFIFIGFAALVAFIAYASSNLLIERLITTDGEELRFLIYPKIVDGIMQRPWLGHGLGAFQEVFRASVPLEGGFAEWDMAHSSYLENVFELGLPAATAFYVALGVVGAKILQGVGIRRKERMYACVSLACFVTALVHAMIDFSLQMPATAALFAIILALGWSQSFSQLARRKVMISD